MRKLLVLVVLAVLVVHLLKGATEGEEAGVGPGGDPLQRPANLNYSPRPANARSDIEVEQQRPLPCEEWETRVNE